MSIKARFTEGVALSDSCATGIKKISSSSQSVLSMQDAEIAFAEISQWPGYQPTPLRSLDVLCDHVGCAEVLYKDESTRFGLGSFKALGGAYAVLRLVAHQYREQRGKAVSLAAIRQGELSEFTASMTVTTATDGNHGRSVAWGARNAGCNCRIYIHREVSDGRKEAMEALGATVVRIDGDYDESVRHCAAESSTNDWHVVSDTSYGDYMSVPRDVMAGYTVIASEVLQQTDKPITHLFVQAGVGGLAGAVAARLWLELNDHRPTIILVESEYADCWLQSFRRQEPTAVSIERETVMAGLSCGEVSVLAWDILSQCADHVITLPDRDVATAMKLFADGQMGGGSIEAGECAVPGALALMCCGHDSELQKMVGIGSDSRVLLLGCEGATDPVVYRRLLESVTGWR